MNAPGDAAIPPDTPGLSARTLLALALLAFAVRVGFILLEPGSRVTGDENFWLGWAYGEPGGLATERVRFSWFRNHMLFAPPLYPYFIAALGEAFGSLAAVKIGQAALGALLTVAIARLGAMALGRRAGAAAGLAAALYPDLVWFTAHFWSEILFMTFLWWAFERLLAFDREPSFARAASAGVLWGLAVLTRETALYFVVVAAVWLAWRRDRRRIGGAAVYVAATLLTVAPWTYRNWVEFHAFIPVSTAGGQNLFQGNTAIPRDQTYEMVKAVQGRYQQYRYALRMGLQAIRDRQPWWIFEKLRDEMPNFWEADNLALIHIKRGADDPPGGYGPTRVGIAWAAAAVMVLPYLAVLGAFVLGLRDLPLSRPVVLLLSFLLYSNAIHIVTHGFARYRLPAMPVVFLIAAWGLCAPAGARAATSTRRRIAAVVAVVLVLCVIPSLRKTAAHPAFAGHGARAAAPAGEAPAAKP